MRLLMLCYRIVLILILTLCCRSREPLAEDFASKDLYKTLGVPSSASTGEIKKAYRKLAQLHHPDKVAPATRAVNEEIFRDVAAAYEVLGSEERRSEYDSLRRRQSQQEKQQYRYAQYQQQQKETMETMEQRAREWQREMERAQREQEEWLLRKEEELEDFFASAGGGSPWGMGSPYWRPVVAGHIVTAGMVIFPYQPILLSPDRAHFALLDSHCSFSVFRGDVDELMHHLLRTSSLDLTDLAVELIFRTTSEPALKGYCFAAVDDRGVFSVFQGHPDDYYSPIWQSTPPEMDYSLYFSRYYLELTSSGEIAVLNLKSGDTEPSCVWSSTHCNFHGHLAVMAKLEVARLIRSVSRGLVSFARFLHRLLGHLDEVLAGDDPLSVLKSKLKETWSGIVSFFE